MLFYEHDEVTSSVGTPNISVCIPLEDVMKIDKRGCEKTDSCRIAKRSIRFGLWIES